MRNRIVAIIERELARLDTMSRDGGLDNKATTRFKLLIDAYKSFVAEPPAGTTTGATPPPASIPASDLLSELQTHPGDVQPA